MVTTGFSVVQCSFTQSPCYGLSVRGAFDIPHCPLGVIMAFGREGFGSMTLSRCSA